MILPKWCVYVCLCAAAAGMVAISLEVLLVEEDGKGIERAVGLLSCQVIVAAIIISDAIRARG